MCSPCCRTGSVSYSGGEELQQLTNKTARTVPLNVDDQVVRICVVFRVLIHSWL
jgi:hypothetical protein